MAISLLRTQLASAWPCRGGCAGRRWRPSWARGEGHEEAQGPRCTPSPGGPAGHTAGPSGCRHCPAVSWPPSESAAKEMMGEEKGKPGRKPDGGSVAGAPLGPGGCSVSGPQRSRAGPGQPAAGVPTQDFGRGNRTLFAVRVLCSRFPPAHPTLNLPPV